MTNIKNFKENLDIYGANLQRWPVGAAEEARHLLQQNEEARTAFEEARRLDDMMDGFAVPALDPDVLTQTLHSAHSAGMVIKGAAKTARVSCKERSSAPFGIAGLFPWVGFGAGGLALACVAGFVLLVKPDASSTAVKIAGNNVNPVAVEDTVLAADIETLDREIAKVYTETQQDIAQIDEMIGWLELADNSTLTPREEQEIEEFLESLGLPAADADPDTVPAADSPSDQADPTDDNVPDIWDAIMKS